MDSHPRRKNKNAPRVGHPDPTTIPREALNKSLGNASIPSGAKARVDIAGFMYGLKPVPFT
jgi:hypothetical protein